MGPGAPAAELDLGRGPSGVGPIGENPTRLWLTTKADVSDRSFISLVAPSTYGHLFKAAKAALADALEATFQTSQAAATAEPRPKNQTRALRSVR
jgi:hypothetical protein